MSGASVGSDEVGNGAEPVPTCDGHPATIVGSDGWERLVGTPGPDVIVGLGGDDLIEGRGGDDLLCGDEDSDTIRGGAGDDHLFGGADGVAMVDDMIFRVAGDTLEPGPGRDTVDVGYGPGLKSYAHRWYGDVLSYGGSRRGVTVDLAAGTVRGQGLDTLAPDQDTQVIGVLGSPENDVIEGSSVSDWIDAGSGDDLVLGRRGRDYVIEPAYKTLSGDDRYVGGPGNDVIWTDDGRDTLAGGPGNDDLWAGQTGSADGAVIRGGPGSERVAIKVVGPHWTYDAGTGDDRVVLQLATRERTVVDLTAGLVSHAGLTSQVTGAEVSEVYVPGGLRLTGTDRPDYVIAQARSLAARLGDGRDHLLIQDPLDGDSDIDLGAGNDYLWLAAMGGVMTTHLGPGDDKADTDFIGPPYPLHEFFGGQGTDEVTADVTQHVVCHGVELGPCAG